MSTVFLIDDDPGVRRSLARVLCAEGFEVLGFESAEDFLARPDHAARGCIVLDVSMPGLDGLELQSQLFKAGDLLPIVFLTGRGDIPMTVRAMKNGAVDFLTKPVAGATLVSAVRAAVKQMEAAQQTDAERTDLSRRYEALTPREREVLYGLIEGKLNKQIAGELGVVEQTVKFHRSRVMERMRARTLSELMHMTARLGIGISTNRPLIPPPDDAQREH